MRIKVATVAPLALHGTGRGLHNFRGRKNQELGGVRARASSVRAPPVPGNIGAAIEPRERRCRGPIRVPNLSRTRQI